jgi:pilus assembly protein CpaE
MPPNPILICAAGEPLRAHLEETLTASGYSVSSVASPADAATSMRDRPTDLIVAEGLAVSGAIQRLRTASGNGTTPILIVAPARDLEARIAFLEAGADDVIPATFERNELESRVLALLVRFGSVRPESGNGAAAGELLAFFSPKGGVGTTTLAVNTAVLLAGGAPAPEPGRGTSPAPSPPGSRVLLIDLDLQFGQVATHLNLVPRFDLAGLASDEPALADAELANSYLTRHSSGVAVLAAPTNPEADHRVTLDQLQRIVEIFRPSFDQLVFDLGNRIDARTLWVLEQADTHVLVIFPEIAALRAMSLLLSFLAETAALRAQTHFVVNHIFPKELLKTRDIENLLRARPAAEIPYTDVEMIRAVNEGVPLVIAHPASPAAAALRRMAQTILGIKQAQTANPKQDRRSFRFGRR